MKNKINQDMNINGNLSITKTLELVESNGWFGTWAQKCIAQIAYPIGSYYLCQINSGNNPPALATGTWAVAGNVSITNADGSTATAKLYQRIS